MGLNEVYAKIEDRWYGFVEWLDKKNVPLYKVVDAMEAKNIPSFPVFLILFLLIIAGVIFLASGMLVQTTSLSVLVTDADDNPLSGATVSVSSDAYEQEKTTDNEGIAQFENVPLNKELTVSATKGDYKADEETVTLAEKGELALSLEKMLSTIDKTISFIGAEGELIEDNPFVQFSCSNSDVDYSATEEIVDGEITLTNIPENCGQLIIENIVGFSTEVSEIDLAESAPQIELQKETNVGKGTVVVSVKNADGNPVFGIIVMLMHSDDTLEQQLETPASGTVIFDSVPADSYYIVVSSNGDFEEYKSEAKALNANFEITFNATLTKASAGKIKIQAMNKDNVPVNNATVKLMNNNVFVKTDYTDAEGKAEFTVSVNTSYGLEIDHPDYLIFTEKGVAPKEGYYTYVLETLTSENAQSIEASIIDASNNPVESTTVMLRNSDGTPVGNQQVTGADGKTEFMNVKIGEYYVYAVKEGFDGEVSANFNVEAKKTTKVSVTLNIGSGTLNLNLMDEDKNPLQGAQVKAFNLADGKLLEEGTSDVQGKTSFSIRADKKVYFIIESSKYLPYVTLPYSPLVNSEQIIDVELVKDVAALTAKFKGFTLNEETVQNSVSAGKKYNAILQLYVPAETNYDKIALHFRTGNEEENKTNLMEEDSLFIKKVISSASKVKKATTYSPNTNMSTDMANLTAGDAKWADLIWELEGDMPKAGVFNAAVEVEIRDEATEGDVVYVYYRGYAVKGTTYIRDPTDEELKTTENAPLKQSLFAKAKAMPYSIGPSNLCSNNFCRQFEVEDLDAKLKTAIVDSYVGKITGTYTLNFKITKTSVKKYQDSTLTITNESGGLKIKEYAITTPSGKTLSKKLDGYTLEETLGTLGEGSLLSGTLTFETEKEGTNLLDIKVTADKEEIFAYSIAVDVEPAKEMSIDMLPKAVVPYIDNKLLFKVSDSENNPIVNAFVNVELDGVLIKSGTTDNAGILALELEAPQLGAALKVTAKKNSYKTVVKEVMVNSDLLQTNPVELSLEMTPSTGAEIALPLILRNLTFVPFKVKGVSLSKDLTQYVKIKSSDFVNTVVDLNKDYNGSITFELTDAGKLTEKTVNATGVISVIVENADLGKEWLVQLPLQFRIVLGLELDNLNCLGLLNKKGEPIKEITFVTTKYAMANELMLKNGCTVTNNSVTLKNLTVKIKELEEKQPLAIGTFRLESEKMPNEIVLLDGSKAAMLGAIEKGSEIPLTLKFTPSELAKSASQTATLVFEATHLSLSGEEKIKLEYKVKIVINYLQDCVKIVKPEYMELFTCANNTGLGMFPGYFGSGLGMNQGFNGLSGLGGMGNLGGFTGMESGQFGMSGYNMPFNNTGLSNWSNSQYPNTFMNPTGIGSTTLGSMNYGQGMQGDYSLYAQPSYPNTMYNTMNPMTTGYGMGMDSFGAGAYGNTNWICEQTKDAGKVKLQNNCDISVELKIEPSSQLQVKENEIKLEPKQEKEIIVEPGIFSGVYPIAISGKLLGSNTDLLELSKFNVTVMRLGDIQDRCKPTMTPTTLNVGFIGWNESKAKIYNSCYNMGYRLMPFGPQNISCYTITQAESMMGQGTQLGQPQVAGQTQLGQTLPGQLPQMSQYGSCDLVRFLIASPPRVVMTAQGMSEVVELSLRYDPQVITQWPGNVPGTLNEQFGNMRIAANRQAKSIIIPGQAIVNYRSPFMMQTLSEVIPITLMDYWQFSGVADIVMKNGNPSVKAEDCIPTENKKGFLDMEAKYGILTDTHFTADRFVYYNGGDIRGHALMRVAYDRHEVLEQKLPVCGEGDFINELEKTYFEDESGVKLYFERAYGNHSIIMVMDRSEMKTKCAVIDEKLPVRVTRIYYGGTSPVIYIPIKIKMLNTDLSLEDVGGKGNVTKEKCLKTKHDKEKETEEEKQKAEIYIKITKECKIECTGLNECLKDCLKEKCEECDCCKKKCKKCEEGGEGEKEAVKEKTPLYCAGNFSAETGEEAYKRYGFDKYLLTWDKEEIKEKTCTVTAQGGDAKFCDGAQFVLSLVKWKENAKEQLGKIDTSTICKLIDCTKIKTLKQLYVFTKETVPIKSDDESNKYYLFFMDKTKNELLKVQLPADKKDCKDIVQATKNKIKEAHDNGNFSQLNGVLDAFDTEMSACYGKGIDSENVVAELSKAEVTKLLELHAITKEFATKVFDNPTQIANSYFLTFKEYALLHTQLLGQTDTTTSMGNCKNADTCKATYADSKEITGNSNAWKEFLQDLYKLADFKVAYMYKSDNSSETVDTIIEHGKDKGTIDSGFLEKKAEYLIGDGFYTTDFAKDFEEQYSEDISMWNFFVLESPTGTDNKSIIATGKGSGLWYVSFEPEVSVNSGVQLSEQVNIKMIIAKTLKEIDDETGTAFANNMYLYVPFDGYLAAKDKTGDSKRDSYGAVLPHYATQSKDAEDCTDNSDCEEDESCIAEKCVNAETVSTLDLCANYENDVCNFDIINVMQSQVSEQANNVTLFGFSNLKFAGTQDGMVLGLEKYDETSENNLFNFYHNASLPLALKLESKESGTLTAYYRLVNGAKKPFEKSGYAQPLKKIDKAASPHVVKVTGEKNAKYIAEWLDNENKAHEDTLGEYEVKDFSCEALEDNQYAAKMKIEGTGLPYKTVLTPPLYTQDQIEIACTNKDIKMTGMSFGAMKPEETDFTKSPEGGTIHLVTSGADDSPNGLKEYFDMIKESKICIEANSYKTELYWNSQAFLNLTD